MWRNANNLPVLENTHLLSNLHTIMIGPWNKPRWIYGCPMSQMYASGLNLNLNLMQQHSHAIFVVMVNYFNANGGYFLWKQRDHDWPLKNVAREKAPKLVSGEASLP